MGESAEISSIGDNDVDRIRGRLVRLTANELDVDNCLAQSRSPLSILSFQVLAPAFDDDDFLRSTITDAADGEVGVFGQS